LTFTAPLRLRLDSDALMANWKTMAALSGQAATGAAVKANAYGLGAREVVARLWSAGCRDFFVAHWDEAVEIADLVPPASIAVLNGICDEDISPALELGAVPVLNTPHQVALWKQSGGGRCHVMLDSGINRLGVGPEHMADGLLDGLDVDILMSHLASADEDSTQNAQQLNEFSAMVSHLSPQRKSLANSAGIALGHSYHFDLTRPGLALYGGIASSNLEEQIRQVVFPEARILQVRDLKAGAAVGYNATFVASSDMRVATLAIGYADGYFRSLGNSAHAIFAGRLMPVIGRISMDLTLVDATQCPDVTEGMFAQLAFDIRKLSQNSAMSQYELLTGLGHRSERIWS
jgi:alanine racemase